MKTKLRYVGLDVHKDTIAVAVADVGQTPAMGLGIVPNDTTRLIKELKKLGPAAHLGCCYEAGPTGYGLSRELNKAGFETIVVAPSLVPVLTGSRVKTDRRDAVKLAHFLRSGDLTPVWVPDEATEAMRDLERARGDAREWLRAARHQLSKFLLRHDRRYPGQTSWTASHLEWVQRQEFAHEAQRRVLVDYLHAVEEAERRVTGLTKDIDELVKQWCLAPLVTGLQALRGVQLITAVTIAAEVGDLKRFSSAAKFMAYVGLVPSEHSSGSSVRRGGITKTGNGHVRRVLVEAAWNYRFKPGVTKIMKQRVDAVSDEVREIAWTAQKRLHKRYRDLGLRGKHHNATVTAVARELAGFIWAIGQQTHLLAKKPRDRRRREEQTREQPHGGEALVELTP